MHHIHHTLVDQIDALLPQTQCTKCGFDGCRPYATAIAQSQANINQCPPGGASTISALAALLQRAPLALNPHHGQIGPRRLAHIDETHCIGCTLCIQACPVDAILGAPKQMHAVFTELCTGCDLCVAPCPVDCIEMVTPQPALEWSSVDANAARTRFQSRQTRHAREQAENDMRLTMKAIQKLGALEQEIADAAPLNQPPDQPPDALLERKRATIQAAIERAQQRQRERASQPQKILQKD